MRPVDWKATQSALLKAGYDPGAIDGAPGMSDPRRPPDVRTMRALLSFAAQRDLGEFGARAGLICATILPKYAITASRDALAQFLANTAHETGNYTVFAENLYYTTPAVLVKNWPTRFNLASALLYLRNPAKLAERVYGGRYGNRPGTSDAFDMRGGGWIQTTFRANYEEAQRVTGLPVATHPELMHDPYTSIEPAAAYWQKRSCNELADQDHSGRSSRVRVNGGTIGLDDVVKRVVRMLMVV